MTRPAADLLAQIAQRTSDEGARPRVMLNACQMDRAGWRLSSIRGFAESFLRAGAGVFVGSLWSVGDTPARTFSGLRIRPLLVEKRFLRPQSPDAMPGKTPANVRFFVVPVNIGSAGDLTTRLDFGMTDMTAERIEKERFLSTAERRLCESTELAEVVDVRNQAEAIRSYAKTAKLGLAVQNHAARIKIRAERRAGAALTTLRLRGGDRKSSCHRDRLKLDDLGISQNDSTRWQQVAMVSEETFVSFCLQADSAGREISSAAFIRYAKSLRKAGDNKGRPIRIRPCHRHGADSPGSRLANLHAEIQDHLRSVECLFAAICGRNAVSLERIERQEIPRYLRELHSLVAELAELSAQPAPSPNAGSDPV